jgi:hypothetical protein
MNPPGLSDPTATIPISDNTRTHPTSPKRCSMQPEVSFAAPG